MAEIATLGPRAAYDLIYGVGGIDAGRVMSFTNRNGLTPEQIITQAAAAVGGANEFIMQRFQGLLYMTTEDHARYRQGDGSARKTPIATEFKQADSVRSGETGHMLPLRDYDDALAWSEQYLRDAYQSQIDADLQLISESWLNRAETDLLTRIFTNTENQIGSGWDVPWAIGTGTNVNFIPPQGNQSQPFDSTHTHFQYLAATAPTKAWVTTLVKELRHHGYGGRLVGVVSEADVDTWASVSGFVALQPTGFQIVTTTANSNVQVMTGEVEGIPGELFGYMNTSRGVIELRYYERIPTGYVHLTKSFGANNPSNGVALRLHPEVPFGLRPDVEITSSLTPKLKGITLKATHGVGIQRRLNGVCGYFASGAVAYVNPAIS